MDVIYASHQSTLESEEGATLPPLGPQCMYQGGSREPEVSPSLPPCHWLPGHLSLRSENAPPSVRSDPAQHCEAASESLVINSGEIHMA